MSIWSQLESVQHSLEQVHPTDPGHCCRFFSIFSNFSFVHSALLQQPPLLHLQVLVTSFADVHATSYVVQSINIHKKLLISLHKAGCQLSKTCFISHGAKHQSINTRVIFRPRSFFLKGISSSISWLSTSFSVEMSVPNNLSFDFKVNQYKLTIINLPHTSGCEQMACDSFGVEVFTQTRSRVCFL